MSSQPNIICVRPVRLMDAQYLQTLCWSDRSLDGIAEMIRRAEKLVFTRRGLGVVAEREGVPCAFGLLTLWPRTAEISDLIVHAPYRDQGIGSQIITYLSRVACKLQAQILEIGVALSNPRALALYRRLGFEYHHSVKIDLGNGPETVLYLYKRLQPTVTNH